MSFDYDLFVIGGGSGGVRAARVASATGAKVALAEEYRMGGTCVIRGCVPKKLMVFASSYEEQMHDAASYGWDVKIGKFEWSGFRKKMHTELDRLEGIYRKLLDGSDVTIYDSRAVLDDPHTVKLADGTKITAKHILVATGGHPVRPSLANADLGLVSNDIFLMEELPKDVLIVGGGYIACEFACILHGLGVNVSMYVRGAGLLRGFDEEACGLISEAMQSRGINIHTGTTIVEMAPAADIDIASDSKTTMGAPVDVARDLAENPKSDTDPEGAGPIWVRGSNGTEQVFQHVIFATGRAANTDGLGLEAAGVKLGRGGAIDVDEYSQTAVPSIFAIGDVTDRVQLTPVAIREAMAFVDTVFNGKPTKVDHDLIPSAVFTQPEMGTVGLTEEQASEQEEVEIYCTSFRPMQSAFAERPDRVLMKLVVSKANCTVLGCHIVADGAGEMIQLAAIAIKMGATKEDFDRTVAVHPTMSEELVTMKEPVRTA